MAVNLAMERKPSHREMTSVLLSDMYGQVLLQEDIAVGFDRLLENLPDLVLDTPDAPTVRIFYKLFRELNLICNFYVCKSQFGDKFRL